MHQVQEVEQKKVAQEMFAMSSKLNNTEERLRDTIAADRTKAEVIREMKAGHQAEMETLSHSSRLSSRQQVRQMCGTLSRVIRPSVQRCQFALLLVLTDDPHTCSRSVLYVCMFICV